MNWVNVALGLAIAGSCSACAAPESREAARPLSRPSSIHRLSYDAAGELIPSSRATLDAALADAATATDILVLSHGWWNDATSAKCTYGRMLEGLDANRPAAIAANRRLVAITIYWPSAVLPIGDAVCGAPATDEPMTESSRQPSRFRAAAVPAWIAAAFPDATRTPAFPAERDRVQALLAKTSTAPDFTRREGIELLGILSRWERQAGREAGPAEAAGEQDIRVDPRRLADAWVPGTQAQSPFERSGPSAWLNAANVFTFWAMKARAGVVGSHGVYQLIRALQPQRARGARIHLVAHSFGGKVLSAAMTGHGQLPNHVDSFLILQGALSHFAFSTTEELRALHAESSQPGLYRQIATASLVHGVFAATYSAHDSANRFWYPKGVRLSRDDFEATPPPNRWGSLGSDGFQGPPATSLSLTTVDAPGGNGLWNIEASDVIGSHSDFLKPEVFRLMWTLIERR